MQRIEQFQKLCKRVIDLSSDFRLQNAEHYEQWYGRKHASPSWLGRFVYGIPELHRREMQQADLVSGAGCNATVTILGLLPLFREHLIEERVVTEVKVGSSEGGNTVSLASHHPERSRALRSFMPTGHRHSAEIVQELGKYGNLNLHLSATTTDLVRGILATSHVFLKEDLEEKGLWSLYRKHYGEEPFIRLVKERRGVYRYPEPKILTGTNFCDVGFEKDPYSKRVVVLSAIDNLMKGAAGQAVQAMNLMLGLDEKTGLEFPGLHPI